MVLRSRLHVSQEFLDQLRTLRINNRNDLYSTLQFVRDFYPNKSQEDICRIFEIQTQTQFQGQIPEVSGNMSAQGGGTGGGQGPTNAQVVTPSIFVTDPYQANINPVTSEGAKLFLKATQELADDKKLEIKQEKSQIFIDQVTTDAQNFGWGGLVYGVPYAMNATSGTEVKGNLLEIYSQMSLETILNQAYKTWGNLNANLSTALPTDQTVEVLSTGDAN